MTESTTQQATQLQYENIMQHSRSYLQRRDLASYDDIPLYFAWERLYATANANLSIDFISENQLEFSRRKEARLAPRRGMASSFTSFDGRNRRSAYASSYLRSAPSPSMVRLMAHQYREGAAKMRSTRASAVWIPPATEKFGQKEKRKRRKRHSKAILKEIEEELQRKNATLHSGFKKDPFPAAEEELSHPSSFSSEESDEEHPTSDDSMEYITRASKSIRSVSGSSAKGSVYAVNPSTLLASDLSPVKKNGTFSAIGGKAVNQHDINAFNFISQNVVQHFPSATADDRGQFTKHETSSKTPMTKLFTATRNSAEEIRAPDISSPTSSQRLTRSPHFPTLIESDPINETQNSSFDDATLITPATSPSKHISRMSTRKASAASSDGHFDVAEYDQDDRRASRAPGSKEQLQHRMSTRKTGMRNVDVAEAHNARQNTLVSKGTVRTVPPASGFVESNLEYHHREFAEFKSMSLPSQVVWPPGTASSAKKLQPGSHHPIVPPGMEYLVTDEQWKEYWTWLNWYSAWQVWYLKDSKSKKKKAKDQKRRKAPSEAESTASSSRSRAESPRSTNWWLDVSAKNSSSKPIHGRPKRNEGQTKVKFRDEEK